MAKIVVFDSGLASISIIKTIQSISKSDIIYFADQQNFPYGNKSQTQLGSIIKKSIKMLQAQFSPDVLVMASNTPSLMLNITTKKVIGVKPPLKKACKISKITGSDLVNLVESGKFITNKQYCKKLLKKS